MGYLQGLLGGGTLPASGVRINSVRKKKAKAVGI
jgi:hypothetical protein